MRDRKAFLRLLAVLASVLILAAACGGGGDDGGGGGDDQNIPTGGVLRVAGESDTDYMDPVATYYTLGSWIHWGVSRGLTAFRPGGSVEEQGVPVADAATDTGTPNEDNTEWSYTLKDGLEWGLALGGEEIPGVTGEPITSADFKYAVERMFVPSTGAQYNFYYNMLEGVEEFESGDADEISGIETPDEKTIVFRLTKPIGDWPSRLAMPATAAVPESYVRDFDAKKDSAYDEHVVASGPYYIKTWNKGELIEFARNENWSKDTDDLRPAYVDEVYWKLGFENDVGVQKVLDGDYDIAMDVAPDGPALAQVVKDPELRERFINESDNCTSYIFMNTKVEPFDRLEVRQAVNLAIDRENLRKIGGGEYAGDIATSILPPGIAGHLTPEEFNPWGTDNMAGDYDAAKAKMAEAGLADGWDEPITLVGSADDPHPKYVESVRADLEAIGFTNIRTKMPAYPNNYTQFYQVPESETAIGTASGWCQDFADAVTYFEPLFKGSSSIPDGSNYGQVQDSELDAMIEAAAALEPGDERTAAWKEVNQYTTEQAFWVPRNWTKTKIIYAPSIVGEPKFGFFFNHIDWTAIGVDQGGA